MDNKHTIDGDFKFLLDQFISSENHEYKTLQKEVCYFIVERIYNRVKKGHGPKFGAVKIDIDERLIIDGNHRYIAYKLAGFQFEIQPYCKNFSDKPPYRGIQDIVIDTDSDWDRNNPEKVKYCNDSFLDDL